MKDDTKSLLVYVPSAAEKMLYDIYSERHAHLALNVDAVTLKEGALIAAKCLALEGQCDVDLPEKPEEKSYNIFDNSLDKFVADITFHLMEGFARCINQNQLKTIRIKRDIDDRINVDETIISFDEVTDWLEQRNYEIGDWFNEYYDYIVGIKEKIIQIVSAEKIKKKTGLSVAEDKSREELHRELLIVQDEAFQRLFALERLQQALKPEQQMTEKERNNLLKIIGALLGLLLGKSSSGKPYPFLTILFSVSEFQLQYPTFQRLVGPRPRGVSGFAHKQNHINGIENFWNQAKRHMRKFNGVPRQHFGLFLKECEWRFNNPTPQQQLSQFKQ